MLNRYEGNPILTASDFSRPVNSVFNAGAVKWNGEYLLLNRVETLEGTSCLWLARSRDGYHFIPDPAPAIVPLVDGPFAIYEAYGIEDPRISVIDDVCYITYVAYSSLGSLIGLVETRDFQTFERKGFISLPDNKDVVLFPGKVDGLYVRLDRPMGVVGLRRDIWVSYSPDLLHWGGSRLVMKTNPGRWDSKRIGAGAPPIRTDRGWLLIYHGVRGTASGAIYRLGVALLDPKDPSKVLGRAKRPVLAPRAPEDYLGDVGNVVFTCGAVLEEDGELKIYYGAADQVMCLATADIDDLVQLCLERID